MELKALRPLLCIHDGVDEINPLNFLMVMEMSDDSSFFSSDNFRSALGAVFHCWFLCLISLILLS